MTLHRFFLSPEESASDRVDFPADSARQIARVLRLRAGDRVVVLDGQGGECVVQLDTVGSAVSGTVVARTRNDNEPTVRLTLYQGMLKASKLEWVLQKCTEIGVSRFVPIITERSVAAEPNPGRYARFASIVREAAEQSERGIVPAVEPAVPYAAAMHQAAERGPFVVLWEEERTVPLRELEFPTSGEVGLVIGPEGGLSKAEIDHAHAVGGNVATIGPRVLRAETAAMIGAALVLQLTENMG